MKKISLLEQRKIEAGVMKPLIQAFEKELGPEKMEQVLSRTIASLAREGGAALAKNTKDRSLLEFSHVVDGILGQGAHDVEIEKKTEKEYRFRVTRCDFVALYAELGLADLGYTLSCQRDGLLAEGFSPDLQLTRTQTLMEGAPYCDFRFHHTEKPGEK